MEKYEIPTTEVTIGEGEEAKKVLLYQWLTQDQTSQYRNLIMNKPLDMAEIQRAKKAGKEIELTVTMESLDKAKKVLIESLCKDLSWEEYNSWRPNHRQELYEEALKNVGDSKK